MAQFTSVEHDIAQQSRQDVISQTTLLNNECDLARRQHDTQMTSRNELAQAISHQHTVTRDIKSGTKLTTACNNNCGDSTSIQQTALTPTQSQLKNLTGNYLYASYIFHKHRFTSQHPTPTTVYPSIVHFLIAQLNLKFPVPGDCLVARYSFGQLQMVPKGVYLKEFAGSKKTNLQRPCSYVESSKDNTNEGNQAVWLRPSR
eukprot:2029272-Amphidinium_carterae.1